MASAAPRIASLDRARFEKRHQELRDEWLTPSADRRDRIEYPSGHVVKVHRVHLDKVLAVKAGMEGDVA